jgi:hypothetical protein
MLGEESGVFGEREAGIERIGRSDTSLEPPPSASIVAWK